MLPLLSVTEDEKERKYQNLRDPLFT